MHAQLRVQGTAMRVGRGAAGEVRQFHVARRVEARRVAPQDAARARQGRASGRALRSLLEDDELDPCAAAVCAHLLVHLHAHAGRRAPVHEDVDRLLPDAFEAVPQTVRERASPAPNLFERPPRLGPQGALRRRQLHRALPLVAEEAHRGRLAVEGARVLRAPCAQQAPCVAVDKTPRGDGHLRAVPGPWPRVKESGGKGPGVVVGLPVAGDAIIKVASIR
mmetsp:Transcript_52202/g.162032  ORF Transcript_52202/g.162032 Transcript_52202/m.162032 type:complete len:221 (-) Transcript_52202:471-1133(-)